MPTLFFSSYSRMAASSRSRSTRSFSYTSVSSMRLTRSASFITCAEPRGAGVKDPDRQQHEQSAAGVGEHLGAAGCGPNVTRSWADLEASAPVLTLRPLSRASNLVRRIWTVTSSFSGLGRRTM